MKVIPWLCLFVCVSFVSSGQANLDTLKYYIELSKKRKDLTHVPNYQTNIGFYFLNDVRNYDSAIYYYQLAIDPENKNVTDTLKASAFNGIGASYNKKGYPDSSIYYYLKALQAYTKLNDTLNSILMETNLAMEYRSLGLYEKALENSFNALNKLERIEPGQSLASCYNTIGSIYDKLDDYPNALVYFRKALKVRKDIQYERGVGLSHNNIGEIYTKLSQYDSALSNFLKAITIKRKINDQNSLATTLLNIGDVYLHRKELTTAESYLIEALKIKQASGERLDEAAVLNSLGKLKLLQNKYVLAEQYLTRAEKLIKESRALSHLPQNLMVSIDLYKTLGNHSKALSVAQELLMVKDSLLNRDKAESLIAIQTRYETEKKEQQIKLLEQDKLLQQAEIAGKKWWILSLSLISALVTVIGAFIFYGYKQSQRNKRNAETLLKEIHHRVKNNLQILSSILNLQSQYLTDEKAIEAIRSTLSRVDAMALIHKKLYREDANRSVQLRDSLKELVEYLMKSYGFTEQTLTLNLTLEDVELDVDKAIPLGLVLNELLSNVFKHAFLHHPNPELSVLLQVPYTNEIRLVVSDNGPGLPQQPTQDLNKSFGLKLVTTLLKELKGKMTTETLKGTAITIQLPIT